MCKASASLTADHASGNPDCEGAARCSMLRSRRSSIRRRYRFESPHVCCVIRYVESRVAGSPARRLSTRRTAHMSEALQPSDQGFIADHRWGYPFVQGLGALEGGAFGLEVDLDVPIRRDHAG